MHRIVERIEYTSSSLSLKESSRFFVPIETTTDTILNKLFPTVIQIELFSSDMLQAIPSLKTWASF